MNKKVTSIAFIIVLGFILFVYRNWFGVHEIIGGDWPYYWRDSLSEMRLWPSLWAPWQGNGLGGVNPLLGLQLFQSYLVTPFVNWLGLPWVIVYKIGWFGLFIAVSLIGSKSLWEAISPRSEVKKKESENSFPWWTLTALIFTTNTYILMVTGGGQMGVALAYAVAPLVLVSFIRLIDFLISPPQNFKFKISNFKFLFIAGLLFGFQVMIDPRIAYVTMMGVGLYYIVTLLHCYIVKRIKLLSLLFPSLLATLLLPLVIVALLNAFWLVPMIMMRNNPLASLGSTYTSIGSLRFFSFADFSHALSLLHPNWPENLFGKTYFLQPEFLVLPIVAFGSLLFLKNPKSQIKSGVAIIFFVLLGLLGTFLAKGANPPFGELYQWLFTNLPGFVMFRDPTKFYLLIAIAYSVLIPFTLNQLASWFSIKYQASSIKQGESNFLNTKYLILIPFFLFWLFTIRQAILGQLGGTFGARQIPQEYLELKDFLHSQSGFFRTLWVPRQQRFAYVSQMHPAMEAAPLFGATDSASLIAAFRSHQTPETLEAHAVKYIIIPNDSLGEIFLDDRSYSPRIRADLERAMDTIGWLKKIDADNIAVYETPVTKDHFWLVPAALLRTEIISPSHYRLILSSSQPVTIVFSESYHPGWVAVGSSGRIISQKTSYGLNSFMLGNTGTQTIDIIFEPEKYTIWGRWMSAFSLVIVVVMLQLTRKKQAQL